MCDTVHMANDRPMQQTRMQLETYEKLREYQRQLKYKIPLSDLITKAVELFLSYEGRREDEECGE